MVLAAKRLFDGVYSINGHLATKNMVPGVKVYGEELHKIGKTEYRWWNPYRSKIGAAVKKGLKFFPFKKGSIVLYLGSSEGTTVSHISDIVGPKGVIFGVDINAKVMQKFIYLCEKRKNLIPVLEDANKPELLLDAMGEIKADVVFQDISQKNQSEIFLKNCREFLKPKGHALISVKARSINPVDNAKKIVEEQRKEIAKELRILQALSLEPFEKEHGFFVCEKK
ncbi:MAG: fibrillarin-like rRNA/tRNA 2'-O-methyltransferase [Candidatus Diapherotrites archaeon]|nr:fibrillarin-like rRNA/tRNA 2'-O-methyltransferase [Candidatus Diapherotrites archaeon]